jgi:hypothetical protein
MTSTDIVPASGTNFAQQGSIDWVALSNSQIAFSVNVLARLSRAGIEPITIGMGRAICLGFELKPSAQEQISMALSRLKAFKSYGDVVYFGFGIRHILFELQHTEQGSACVGLCACLRANYSSWYGAVVFRELCLSRGAPRNLTPSLHQWEALLNSCGGVLGPECRFSQLVDAFSRLMNRYSSRRQRAGIHKPVLESSLAKALLVLIDVASGRIDGAQFTGGAEGNLDCAWVGAIAEWLFCLDIEIWVEVEDASPGPEHRIRRPVRAYRSPGTREKPAQVTIFSEIAQAPAPATLISEKVHVLSGQFLSPYTGQYVEHMFEQRSPWTTILYDSFGQTAEILFNVNYGRETSLDQEPGSKASAFAIFLRCMAHSLEMSSELVSVTKAYSYCTHEHPKSVRYINYEHRGDAFIAFASRRFPELQDVLELNVHAKHGIPEEEIIRQFDACFGDDCDCASCLKCYCSECQEETIRGRKPIYCPKDVALFMVETLRLLSSVTVDQQILPSSRGFLEAYNSFLKKRRSGKPGSRDYDHSVSGELDHLLKLFSRAANGSRYKTSSAVSADGACAFYKILQEPNVPLTGLTAIMVIPGRVELDDHPYQTAFDSTGLGLLEPREDAMFSITDDLELRLVGTEGKSHDSFELGYQVMYGSTWHKIPTAFLHTEIFNNISYGSSSRVCQDVCGRHTGDAGKKYAKSDDTSRGEDLDAELTTEENDTNDDISSGTSSSNAGAVPRSEQLAIRFLDVSPTISSAESSRKQAYKSTIDATRWWILVRWWNKAGPGRIQYGYQIANRELNSTAYSQLYAKASLATGIPPPGCNNRNFTLYFAQCLECAIRGVEDSFINKRKGHAETAKPQPYAYDKALTRQEAAKWGHITSMIAPAFSVDIELSTDKPWTALNNAVAAEGPEQAKQSTQSRRGKADLYVWEGASAASYDDDDDSSKEENPM